MDKEGAPLRMHDQLGNEPDQDFDVVESKVKSKFGAAADKEIEFEFPNRDRSKSANVASFELQDLDTSDMSELDSEKFRMTRFGIFTLIWMGNLFQ